HFLSAGDNQQTFPCPVESEINDVSWIVEFSDLMLRPIANNNSSRMLGDGDTRVYRISSNNSFLRGVRDRDGHLHRTELNLPRQTDFVSQKNFFATSPIFKRRSPHTLP